MWVPVYVAALAFIVMLIRPVGQGLAVFAVFPFVSRVFTMGQALKRAVLFMSVLAVLMLGWSFFNYASFGQFSLYSYSGALLPFARTFIVDKSVRPENGDASRQLADIVQQHILDKDPYSRYGVDVEAFFANGSSRLFTDLVYTLGRLERGDAAFQLLQRAGIEAIAADPIVHSRSLLATFVSYFLDTGFLPPSVKKPSERISVGERAVTPERLQTLRERWEALPDDRREIVPYGYHTYSAYLQPDVKPTDPRVADLTQRMVSDVPPRDGNPEYERVLRLLWKAAPPVYVWLIVGLGMFLGPMRAEEWSLVFFVAAALAIIAVTSVAGAKVNEYRLPFDPVFLMFGVLGAVRVVSRGMRAVKAVGTARR